MAPSLLTELDALRWFLDAQRSSALAIIEGLDETQLRTAVLPSGWTPLGLLEHLGHAERHWFQDVVFDSVDPLPWSDADADDNPLGTSRSTGVVLDFYRDQIRRSNAVLDSTPLDQTCLGSHDQEGLDEVVDLRTVVLHMIEETARHCGHLDAARELIDGRTGLGPR